MTGLPSTSWPIHLVVGRVLDADESCARGEREAQPEHDSADRTVEQTPEGSCERHDKTFVFTFVFPWGSRGPSDLDSV